MSDYAKTLSGFWSEALLNDFNSSLSVECNNGRIVDVGEVNPR